MGRQWLFSGETSILSTPAGWHGRGVDEHSPGSDPLSPTCSTVPLAAPSQPLSLPPAVAPLAQAGGRGGGWCRPARWAPSGERTGARSGQGSTKSPAKERCTPQRRGGGSGPAAPCARAPGGGCSPGPARPLCPCPAPPRARRRYLPEQAEDVHGVLPLVLPDGGLDLPQPAHPPHVGSGRGFPQHPGQLLRVQEQRGEVEVAPAALQPAGAGLLAALLLQAALPAQPGAHGRAPAAPPPLSGPGGLRAPGSGPGEAPGKAGGRQGEGGGSAPPCRPRPGSPRCRRSRGSSAPGLRGSVLSTRLPGGRAAPLPLRPGRLLLPGLFCREMLGGEDKERRGCCRDCSFHPGILGSYFIPGQTL